LPGSLLQAFIQTLDRHDVQGLRQFYGVYSALFPFESEREPLEAFQRMLELNEDRDAQRLYGPYREVVCTVRMHNGAGPVVGGFVFGVITSPAHAAAGYGASIQVSYVFLAPDARGCVPVAEFARYAQDVALKTWTVDTASTLKRPPVLFEVNDPCRMSPQQVAEDTLRSGLHPARRHLFWQRCGSAPLAFPYVQPRLRPDGEPVRFLDLFCIGRQPIPAMLLLAHLRGFVALSVLKGADPWSDPDFVAMALELERGAQVHCVPHGDQRLVLIRNWGRSARPRRPG
jgi:hypothetical protein